MKKAGRGAELPDGVCKRHSVTHPGKEATVRISPEKPCPTYKLGFLGLTVNQWVVKEWLPKVNCGSDRQRSTYERVYLPHRQGPRQVLGPAPGRSPMTDTHIEQER